MEVKHHPGTEHVTIDTNALAAFLAEQKFSQAYIDEVTFVTLPYTDEGELTDDEMDEYSDWIIYVFLFMKRTDIALNQQLLQQIRRSCYENDQSDATDACFANWGISLDDLDEVETKDVLQFANLDCPEFVFVGSPVAV